MYTKCAIIWCLWRTLAVSHRNPHRPAETFRALQCITGGQSIAQCTSSVSRVLGRCGACGHDPGGHRWEQMLTSLWGVSLGLKVTPRQSLLVNNNLSRVWWQVNPGRRPYSRSYREQTTKYQMWMRILHKLYEIERDLNIYRFHVAGCCSLLMSISRRLW